MEGHELSSREDVPPDTEECETDRETEIVVRRVEQLKIHLQTPNTWTPAQLIALLKQALRGPARMLQKFHRKVSQSPLPAITAQCNIETIRKRISSACQSDEIATSISHSLVTYMGSRKTQIKALRATPVYMFNNDEESWPVVEWTESDGMAMLAIFQFDDVGELKDGGWLMHSGLSDGGPEGSPWTNSRIDWNVSDVEHVKLLFKVAQHILGVLLWPIASALKLYCGVNSDKTSVPELTKHAKLLYRHMLRLKQMDMLFDRLSPVLQSLGRADPRFPSQVGSWRLGMSLYL